MITSNFVINLDKNTSFSFKGSGGGFLSLGEVAQARLIPPHI